MPAFDNKYILITKYLTSSNKYYMGDLVQNYAYKVAYTCCMYDLIANLFFIENLSQVSFHEERHSDKHKKLNYEIREENISRISCNCNLFRTE